MMKNFLVICISFLCFTLLAQDIDKLKQSNKTLMDSLLVLNSKFNKRLEKINEELLVLKSSKLQIQTKLEHQDQLRIELENKINQYNISSVNQTIYDTLKRLDIYEVINEQGLKKIRKIRKHLIKSNTIKPTDSLLFTKENVYSYGLDKWNRISDFRKVFIDEDVSEILQNDEKSKKYFTLTKNQSALLERLTGVNQGFLSLIKDISLIQDSIRKLKS